MSTLRWIPLLAPLTMAAMLSGPVGAVTVYRTVDENGDVIFSDEPSPGAVPVELVPPKVERNVETWRVPRGVGAPTQSANPAPTENPYQGLAIGKPAANDTVRSNNGSLPVSVTVDPELFQGHRVMYYMDGDLVASNSGVSTILQGLGGGEHTLIAAIIDSKGLELIRSLPVTFNLLRTTGSEGSDVIPPSAVDPFKPERSKEFERKRPEPFKSERPSSFQKKDPAAFQRKRPSSFEKRVPKPWNPSGGGNAGGGTGGGGNGGTGGGGTGGGG